MIALALSVLCSSVIFVVFKLFDTYKVQTLFAIITNYFVASCCGFLFYEGDVSITNLFQKPWFFKTLALGLLFILIFNIMAKTAQKAGVAVASVATKMSFVIPVIIGVFAYEEVLSWVKVLGIFLAMGAVYFASIKEEGISLSRDVLLLPFMVFLGSGAIDAAIKYFQETQLNTDEFPLFSATVFAAAGTTGLLFVGARSFVTPLKANPKNLLGGLALGIPNYFSIFFLLKALENETWNSASIFTINNVAIVMFSTILGILLFKERLSPKNWGGIVLAVISILIVAFL